MASLLVHGLNEVIPLTATRSKGGRCDCVSAAIEQYCVILYEEYILRYSGLNELIQFFFQIDVFFLFIIIMITI